MQAATIGAVARKAGVNVETIRYYQRIGLVREPARPRGGVRRYPPETVERLRFIKRAQDLGFSLAEIADLQGCALGTVKSNLHHAIARLKEGLVSRESMP